MKKILIFAVLLYSAVAKLCAQTCPTCEGGIIAQCPIGQGHDYRNIYMCFKTTTSPTIGESDDCPLAVVDETETTFKPHKSVVIHQEVKLILPKIVGSSIRISQNALIDASTPLIILSCIRFYPLVKRSS